MSLADRIMGKMVEPDSYHPEEILAYNAAIEDAAQIAKEADELMAELAVCLEELIEVAESSADYADRVAAKVPALALAKYNTYMERNNEQ